MMLIRGLRGLWGGFFQALFSWGWQQPLSDSWLPGCLPVNDKWHSVLWKLYVLLLWTLTSRSQAVTSHCFCSSAVGMLWSRLSAPFLALLKSCFAALWFLASLRFLFFEHEEARVCSFNFPLWDQYKLVDDFLGCRWMVLTVWWRSL